MRQKLHVKKTLFFLVIIYTSPEQKGKFLTGTYYALIPKKKIPKTELDLVCL